MANRMSAPSCLTTQRRAQSPKTARISPSPLMASSTVEVFRCECSRISCSVASTENWKFAWLIQRKPYIFLLPTLEFPELSVAESIDLLIFLQNSPCFRMALQWAWLDEIRLIRLIKGLELQRKCQKYRHEGVRSRGKRRKSRRSWKGTDLQNVEKLNENLKK